MSVITSSKENKIQAKSSSVLDKVLISPFDYDYQQIQNTRKVFEHAYEKKISSIPGGQVQTTSAEGMKLTEKATIEKLFQELSRKIPNLSQDKWRHIFKDLDQAPYDTINVAANLKELQSKSEESKQNLGQSLDLGLLSQKIQFTDFLKALQKESSLRETLSEHQLFYSCTKRLKYKGETRLVTKEAQDAMDTNKEKRASLAKTIHRMQQTGQDPSNETVELVKVPTVTYAIEQLLMFTYQGTEMLLVTRDNKSVQVFESATGRFVHEFKFFNNVLAQLKQQNRRVMQEIDQKKKEKLAQKGGGQQSNAQNLDIIDVTRQDEKEEKEDKKVELMKKKALRDKGIFDCPIPEYRIYRPGRDGLRANKDGQKSLSPHSNTSLRASGDSSDSHSSEQSSSGDDKSSKEEDEDKRSNVENSVKEEFYANSFAQKSNKDIEDYLSSKTKEEHMTSKSRSEALASKTEDQQSKNSYDEEDDGDEVIMETPEVTSILNADTAKDEKFWDWVYDFDNTDQVRAPGYRAGVDDSTMNKMGQSQMSQQQFTQTFYQNAQKRYMDKSDLSKCTSIEEYAQKLKEARSPAAQQVYGSEHEKKRRSCCIEQEIARSLQRLPSAKIPFGARHRNTRSVFDFKTQNQQINEAKQRVAASHQRRNLKVAQTQEMLGQSRNFDDLKSSTNKSRKTVNIVLESELKQGQKKPESVTSKTRYTRMMSTSSSQATIAKKTTMRPELQTDELLSQTAARRAKKPEHATQALDQNSELLLKAVKVGVETRVDAKLAKDQSSAAKEKYDKFESQNRTQFLKAISGKADDGESSRRLVKKETSVKTKPQVVTDQDLNSTLRSDIVGLGESLTKSLAHQAIAEEPTQRNKSSGRSDFTGSINGAIERKLRERAQTTDPRRRFRDRYRDLSPEQRAQRLKEKVNQMKLDARAKVKAYQERRKQNISLANGGYEVLGLNPIDDRPTDMLQSLKHDKGFKKDPYEKTFGLPRELFTPNHERQEHEKEFNELVKKTIPEAIDRNKKLASHLGEVLGEVEKRRGLKGKRKSSTSQNSQGALSGGRQDTMLSPHGAGDFQPQKPERGLREAEETLKRLKGARNGLWRRIDRAEARQSILNGWIMKLDEQQRKEIVGHETQVKAVKEIAQARQALLQQQAEANKKKKLQDADDDEQQKSRPPKDLKQAQEIATQMKRDRKNRLRQHNKEQDLEKEEQRAMKRVEEKATHPLKMDYYEPANLAIFALVTREIQIHELKSTGVRFKFTHIQSLRVQNIVESMSISTHKVSGNLLICCGTQHAKKAYRSEIVIFELNPEMEWEVAQSYRFVWKHSQITNIFYNENCGLVVSSFQGFIEIFDSVNLHIPVWDSAHSDQKQLRDCGSICAADYSEALDLLVFGGVSGMIHFIDQTTKKHNKSMQAHAHEIKLLKFYDQQHQLISVTITGDVGLWDSQKMTKFQVMKNSPNMLQKQIGSTSFYEPKGRILMATTKVFNYELCVDQDVKIHTDQQNAIARDFLRDFFNRLRDCKFIGKESEKTQASKEVEQAQKPQILESTSLKNSRKRRTKSSVPKAPKILVKSISEQQFLETAYEDSTIKDYLPKDKEYNRSVLPSPGSKLVSTIFDRVHFKVYTVDCDLMVRTWSLKTGKSLRSYVLETRDSQIEALSAGFGPSGGSDALLKARQDKKAQLAQADALLKFLVVCFEGGEIQVNHLHTGALIYNNYNVPSLKLRGEVAQLAFFPSQTQFWIAASCFDGKVAFISVPRVTQGRSYLQFKESLCSHHGDVLTLDMNSDNQLVTASIDNVLCFWNTFSGAESKKFVMPEDIASSHRGQEIAYVKFPFASQKDLLLIVVNTGSTYLLEIQAEKFVEFPKTNENQDLESQSSMAIALQPSKAHKPSDGKKMRRSHQQTHSSQPTKAKNYVMGAICPNPIIDLKSSHLVAVGDCGTGFICSLNFNLSGGSQGKTDSIGLDKITKQSSASRAAVRASTNKLADFIDYQVIKEFTIADKDLSNGGPFKSVIICDDHSIFITSQIGGQVTIYDLRSATKLSYLNQECRPHKLPLSLQRRGLNDIQVTDEDKTPMGQQDLLEGFGQGGSLVDTDDTDNWPKVFAQREKGQDHKFKSRAFVEAHARGIEEIIACKQLKQIARQKRHFQRYSTDKLVNDGHIDGPQGKKKQHRQKDKKSQKDADVSADDPSSQKLKEKLPTSPLSRESESRHSSSKNKRKGRMQKHKSVFL